MDPKRIAWSEVCRWGSRPQTMLLGAALALLMLFGRHRPKDQTVHYVLGNAAPRVEEVDARWADGNSSDAEGPSGQDWTRTVSFRYAKGRAPRIVTHEPRLPDGNYTVEIEIVASSFERNQHVTVLRRQVALCGGVTSIDLAPSLVDRSVPR